MDIRLSDGDRIGKPAQGKSGKPAPDPRLAPKVDARGRVEPQIDGRRGPSGDGRGPKMPGGKPPKAEKPARGRAKAASGRRAKKRRSTFGFIGKLFYWLMMLGFWGVVAVGAVVVYYGAQLPSSNTWAIPERPPNIKVLAADGQLMSNRGKSGGEAISLHELPYYVP